MRRLADRVGSWRVSAGVMVLALVALLVPLPHAQVEQWYSRGIYPQLQRLLTSLSNLVPIALLDVAAGLALMAAVWRVRRVMSAARPRVALGRLARGVATFAAAAYLVFLALWGLNYRRVALEQKLAFDAAAVTGEAALALATDAVRLVNANYAGAHAAASDGPTLAAAFAEAQTMLGGRVLATPGVPKRSVLTLYFRWAAIDGMTDPFFLEIIVNPDLLAVERPFVVAHEWAHLAGYADESEASFVAWLTCVRGDAAARYSGWLSLYAYLANALPRDDRRAVAARLDVGPRRDLVAMVARLQRSPPVVRRTANTVYDSYLKANRVQRGIRSYDAVVRLALGVEFDDGWVPKIAR